MQVQADFLDLLRDKGEVVNFQTARLQIEKSLKSKQPNLLQNADTQDLIKALLDQIKADELQGYINEYQYNSWPSTST